MSSLLQPDTYQYHPVLSPPASPIFKHAEWNLPALFPRADSPTLAVAAEQPAAVSSFYQVGICQRE